MTIYACWDFGRDFCCIRGNSESCFFFIRVFWNFHLTLQFLIVHDMLPQWTYAFLKLREVKEKVKTVHQWMFYVTLGKIAMSFLVITPLLSANWRKYILKSHSKAPLNTYSYLNAFTAMLALSDLSNLVSWPHSIGNGLARII